MKRILSVCLFSMVFTLICTAQETWEGPGTWYETPSKSLSASHANLPFGTRVRITNLLNNQQVIATISNRIPNSPDQLIDVSQEAAKNIGMNDTGTTPVRVERLLGRRTADATPETPPATPETPPATPDPEPVTPPPAPPPAVAVAPPAPPPPAPVVETPPPAPPPAPVVETPPPAPPPAPVAAPAPVISSGGGISNRIIITINTRPEGTAAPAAPPVEPPPRIEITPPVVSPPAPVYVNPPAPVRTAQAANILPKMPDPRNGKIYKVQIGSFQYPDHAQEAFNRAQRAGFAPVYERYENYYRVVIPGIRSADMPAVAQRIGFAGFPEAFIWEDR